MNLCKADEIVVQSLVAENCRHIQRFRLLHNELKAAEKTNEERVEDIRSLTSEKKEIARKLAHIEELLEKEYEMRQEWENEILDLQEENEKGEKKIALIEQQNQLEIEETCAKLKKKLAQKIKELEQKDANIDSTRAEGSETCPQIDAICQFQTDIICDIKQVDKDIGFLCNALLDLISLRESEQDEGLQAIVCFLKTCCITEDAITQELLLSEEALVVLYLQEAAENSKPICELLKKFCTKLKLSILHDNNPLIWGQCQILGVICKMLNLFDFAWQLCAEVLLKKEVQGLQNVVSILSVFPELLRRHSNPEKEDIQSRLILYLLQSKPVMLDEESWEKIANALHNICDVTTEIDCTHLLSDIVDNIFHQPEESSHMIANTSSIDLFIKLKTLKGTPCPHEELSSEHLN